ncbi:MIDN protein, partial [Atractosteus spatula]|nr:MIDN protein [Atractosteus spatula]
MEVTNMITGLGEPLKPISGTAAISRPKRDCLTDRSRPAFPAYKGRAEYSRGRRSASPLQCLPSAGSCDRLRQTENRATRCKVERLQLLMQQKRLRRKARRDARAPYSWLPNRKSSRSNSNSSVSSDGSLDLDYEDSVWKPDVKADLKSEFVVA